MDNLQYMLSLTEKCINTLCFKPYYKWITFNTVKARRENFLYVFSFKPYYKWITFNTETGRLY